jgi:hypothetical protein
MYLIVMLEKKKSVWIKIIRRNIGWKFQSFSFKHKNLRKHQGRKEGGGNLRNIINC